MCSIVADSIGSHTYFNVRLKGHGRVLYETKPWSSTSGLPYWNEEFNFVSARPDRDIIIIRVYDLDIHGHHHQVGKARIPVLEYLSRGMVDQWFALAPKRRHQAILGDVHVQFMCGGLPSSYGFLAEPSSLPTFETKTVWVPAAIPYVPLTTTTVQSQVPIPPPLPQMPHSGHTAVNTKPPLTPNVGTSTTYYTPAAVVAPTVYAPIQGTYIPKSH